MATGLVAAAEGYATRWGARPPAEPITQADAGSRPQIEQPPCRRRGERMGARARIEAATPHRENSKQAT